MALLWRLGRYAEMPPYLEEGAEYGRDHDFPTTSRAGGLPLPAARRCTATGTPPSSGLREVLGDPDDPGVLDRHALPALARLAVRRGRPDAESALAAARRNAEQADSLLALVPTAGRRARARLADRAARARSAGAARCCRAPSGRVASATGASCCGTCGGSGSRSSAFPGCPEEYAAGLRGDWRAAAAAWERIGDPYERALELAESGEVGPTLEALAVFDRLGARPAAAWTRRRLRELGRDHGAPRAPADDPAQTRPG